MHAPQQYVHTRLPPPPPYQTLNPHSITLYPPLPPLPPPGPVQGMYGVKGASVLVLSDKMAGADRMAIPSLLAIGAVHQHLIKVHIYTNTYTNTCT